MNKICKDCKHYKKPGFFKVGGCFHPENVTQDLINGKFYQKYPTFSLRDLYGLCGKDGKWFEPKELK